MHHCISHRPVPDLPKKSFFSFINDDFIERRRKGLQSFLDQSVLALYLKSSSAYFLQSILKLEELKIACKIVQKCLTHNIPEIVCFCLPIQSAAHDSMPVR